MCRGGADGVFVERWLGDVMIGERRRVARAAG